MRTLTWARLEVFKMLLASFFPLAVLILAVARHDRLRLATPTEARASARSGVSCSRRSISGMRCRPERRAVSCGPGFRCGRFCVSVVWFLLLQVRGADVRAAAWVGWISMLAFARWCVLRCSRSGCGRPCKESVFLTAKTRRWCAGSSSARRSSRPRSRCSGGQEVIERWVLSLGLSPVQFMILAQVIIFLLGWPLEWTEIIVIFMPIFIPLLAKFNIDRCSSGCWSLNLQTAFLSPPVAMAAFYLKGVAPRMSR
jgi:hypothetical protein